MADGVCNNCGASLLGEYCHRCGQKEAGTDWRSFRSIAREFWDELVSLDFKSVRTIAALVYPGYLAAEFIAGRRRRYLSPLKVYFLAAALFFLVAPRVMDFSFERQTVLDPNGEFRARVEARIAETHVDRALFAERFNARLQTIYTLTPMFSVLSASLILRALFGRRYPWLGPHVVVGLYYVAFIFLLVLVVHGLNEAFDGANINALLALQFSIVLPFVFLTLRRVYGEPPGRTLWKTLVLVMLSFVLDAPMNILAMRLSIAST